MKPVQSLRRGTDNLVAAATAPGSSVKKFVLVTSLLTNAKLTGQKDNDNYKFLNALGGVLDEKLAAELNLRASGLDYTIVRPGGRAGVEALGFNHCRVVSAWLHPYMYHTGCHQY
jgi:uncharacterized protein YbjT (DUF2867 family)